MQFLTQYAQAGLKGQIPLYPVFTIDAISLPQQKELALGIPGAQQWVNDLPNEANKKYVADFKKKHSVYPSFYGAQSYDAIMLIDSAAEALKGDLTNKDKVRRDERRPTSSRCAATSSTAPTTSRSRTSTSRKRSRMPRAM